MKEPSLVEYTGGPVYLADNDKYFPNLAELAEYVWDELMDPATVYAHPCDEHPPYTPDIADRVLEAWREEAAEDIADDIGLSSEAAAKIAELQEFLEKQAPVLWWPRMRERLEVPLIESESI